MALMNMKNRSILVHTAGVLEELKDQGIDETFIILLDNIYKGCTGRIILHNQSDRFPIRNGARMGVTTSPKPFIACL